MIDWGTIITVCALVVAALGLGINFRKSTDDNLEEAAAERERLVRIETFTRSTRDTVNAIKTEMDKMSEKVDDHEKRLTIIEHDHEIERQS